MKNYETACRDCMDSKCTHNNSGDRVGSAITYLGNCSAWLDSWSSGVAYVRFVDLVHVFPPCRMLQIRRPHFWQEKFHLHRCCPLQSWYVYHTFYVCKCLLIHFICAYIQYSTWFFFFFRPYLSLIRPKNKCVISQNEFLH